MTDPNPRALFELERTLGCQWEHLQNADREADHATEDLIQLLGREVGKGLNFPPEDANLVVFGSLARKEWIDWVSDLDWTYLIDGPAQSPHFNTSQDIKAALRTQFRFLAAPNEECQKRKEYRFCEPGPTGTFGSMTFKSRANSSNRRPRRHKQEHYATNSPLLGVQTDWSQECIRPRSAHEYQKVP